MVILRSKYFTPRENIIINNLKCRGGKITSSDRKYRSEGENRQHTSTAENIEMALPVLFLRVVCGGNLPHEETSSSIYYLLNLYGTFFLLR